MKKIVLGLSIVLVALACSKTENAETSTLTLDKYNVAGSYMISGITFRPTDTAIDFDVYNIDTFFSLCKKDDTLTLDTFNRPLSKDVKMEGRFAYYDDGLDCDTNQLGVYSSQYFLSAPNIISGIKTYEYGPDFNQYIVASLTKTQMVLTRLDSVPMFFGKKKYGLVKVTLKKVAEE